MTKAEVLDLVTQQTGISRQQAYDSLEIFLASIKDSLKEGEKVSLVGFGTFLVKDKGSRHGRNPRTGELIDIPAKKVPVFKPGKAFREMVAKKPE